MLKENPTLLVNPSSRMHCHTRSKSMLCDLSLLDSATLGIGNLKPIAHKRSKSTQISFASSVFSLAVPISPSSMDVGVADMSLSSSVVVITPPQHAVPQPRARADSLEDLYPCYSPPRVVTRRTTITLGRPGCEMPQQLLLPSLEDLDEDVNANEEELFLLPRTPRRRPASYVTHQMPWWSLEPDIMNDSDVDDDEVASITARIRTCGPVVDLRPLPF